VRRQLGIALWVLQIILGAAFVVSGAMKLFTFDRYKKMAESKSPQHGLGNSKGFLTFIGACELLGGVR
jgi:uncharacterized membrane protein YphA (DoxX/SURF4 family)